MKKKLLVLLIALASTMIPNLASAVAIDGCLGYPTDCCFIPSCADS